MNLEEYKQSLLAPLPHDIWRDNIDEALDIGKSEGFDAALALDLPIKFNLWYNSKEETFKNWLRENYWRFDGSPSKFMIVDAAYKYWIENIFKIE